MIGGIRAILFILLCGGSTSQSPGYAYDVIDTTNNNLASSSISGTTGCTATQTKGCAISITPHALYSFTLTNLTIAGKTAFSSATSTVTLWYADANGLPLAAVTPAVTVNTPAFSTTTAYKTVNLYANNVGFVLPQLGTAGASATYALVITSNSGSISVRLQSLNSNPTANTGICTFTSVSVYGGSNWGTATQPGYGTADSQRLGVKLVGIIKASQSQHHR
jgi:hypothetical protein